MTCQHQNCHLRKLPLASDLVVELPRARSMMIKAGYIHIMIQLMSCGPKVRTPQSLYYVQLFHSQLHYAFSRKVMCTRNDFRLDGSRVSDTTQTKKPYDLENDESYGT
jgi:hypothetical protein